MRNTVIGILAHVDAGKTTLSESILYLSGAIRQRGRVDHGDAFLDTDEMEKKRGITIYSKLARFSIGEKSFTILDTPGHVDFSPEMERSLRVLDEAILVVSAPDVLSQQGADPQVRILWKLLQHYQVPTFLFLNKLDQILGKGQEQSEEERDKEKSALCRRLVQILTKDLGRGLVFFDERQICPDNEEEIAVCEDALMERVLAGEAVTEREVQVLALERKLFPVYGGSALLDEGTGALLEGLRSFTGEGKKCAEATQILSKKSQDSTHQEKSGSCAECQEESAGGTESAPFGALVYKITRENGTRLTWMKITEGTLSIRDAVHEVIRQSMEAGKPSAGEDPEQEAEDELPETEREIQEKVSELRLYSGDRYEARTSVFAGEIVAAAGLSYTQAGDGLGTQESRKEELLTPIMTSSVKATDRYGKPVDAFTLMKVLRELEEEEPMLHVAREEETGDITVRIMGQVQIEILKNLLRQKYDFRAEFGPGSIVYQETIRRPVEGVGHFEPLRHYAEVHLLLEPGEEGSGITFENRCLPNTLDRNWQNLILSQLSVKSFKGVLTGSGLTDVRICLLGGKASKKHTSGGDFRKAAYAAVRQGLMMAENILLEPVWNLTLEIPAENVGRAMTDISQMHGSCRPAEFRGEEAVLEGTVPASELGDYAATVAGYTGGRGRLSVSWKGYEPCHNAREIIEEKAYDPDTDRRNPTWSVFCSHGAGTVIPWYQVRNYMHVDTGWRPEKEIETAGTGTETAAANRAGYADAEKAAANRTGEAGSEKVAAGSTGVAHRKKKYRSDDYYTFTPPLDEAMDGLMGGLSLDSGEQDSSDQHAAHQKKQQDFKERERKFRGEEEELKRIFEQTYGPIREQLRHPDNVRRGTVLPSEEAGNSSGVMENSSGTMGKPSGTLPSPEGSGKEAGAGASRSGNRDLTAKGQKQVDKYTKRREAEREKSQEEFLLVDGYNIIFAWKELKDLADTDIKSARDRLLDILSDYAGYSGVSVIVVFDAYRVPGGTGSVQRYHNIDVVFTKEAETADLYIEKTAHRLSGKNRVSVATGDFVEQVIIFGAGAFRLSPRGLLEQILFAGRELREQYLSE